MPLKRLADALNKWINWFLGTFFSPLVTVGHFLWVHVVCSTFSVHTRIVQLCSGRFSLKRNTIRLKRSSTLIRFTKWSFYVCINQNPFPRRPIRLIPTEKRRKSNLIQDIDYSKSIDIVHAHIAYARKWAAAHRFQSFIKIEITVPMDIIWFLALSKFRDCSDCRYNYWTKSVLFMNN